MREKLKFKKLLNEFRSLEAEFQYNGEILKDAGETFESACLKWCDDNNVDLKGLQEEKKKKVSFKPRQQQHPPEEDYSIAESKEKPLKHKDVFKSVAKKIHPDKLEDEDPRFDEFKSAFQRANTAMSEGEWGGLFDVIDKYNIDIQDYDEANESLEKDIKRMKEKLKSQKSTYAWILHECEADIVRREIVIQSYLKQVYGWDGSKKS